MPDYVISVDAGNGGTNALRGMKSKDKRVYFPSVRASATGDSLGLGQNLELEYDYADWGGHRYIVGDDCIKITRRHIEHHRGTANRYGNEFHSFLVAMAAARLGVKKGEVDLTVFAPPGMYVEAKDLIKERFDEPMAIQLKGDSKPRQWTYSEVTVWPEGIGAAACFALDSQGNVVNSDVLAGDTIILDMGLYTLDALKMVDGNFNPEALEHATWEAGGLGVHILEPILRGLKKHSGDFEVLTTDDVDFVIRSGLTSGEWTIRSGGSALNIQKSVDKYSERFAGWLANNVLDGVFQGLRGIKSVIITGGGATLVDAHLREWYGDKILDPREQDATKDIHPVDMNAAGGLRLAQMRLK